MDHGRDRVPVTLSLDTSCLKKKGASLDVSFTGAQTAQMLGIKHADLANVREIEVSAHSTAGDLGFTFMHPKNLDKGVPTHEKMDLVHQHIYYNASKDNVTAHEHHFVATKEDAGKTARLAVVPSSEMFESNKDILQRRMGTNWDGHDVKNIVAGAHKTTLDGDTRAIIKQHGANGEPSAIWNLLDINKKKPLLGGKFHGGPCHDDRARGISCICHVDVGFPRDQGLSQEDVDCQKHAHQWVVAPYQEARRFGAECCSDQGQCYVSPCSDAPG